MVHLTRISFPSPPSSSPLPLLLSVGRPLLLAGARYLVLLRDILHCTNVLSRAFGLLQLHATLSPHDLRHSPPLSTMMMTSMYRALPQSASAASTSFYPPPVMYNQIPEEYVPPSSSPGDPFRPRIELDKPVYEITTQSP